MTERPFRSTPCSVHLALPGGDHVLVAKHTEVKSIRAPQSAEEIEDWLDRPLIPSYRCG